MVQHITYHHLPFVNALNVDLFRAGWPRQARAAKVSPSGVRPFVGQVQPCYRLRRQCFSRRIFGLPTVEDPAAQFLPLSFELSLCNGFNASVLATGGASTSSLTNMSCEFSQHMFFITLLQTCLSFWPRRPQSKMASSKGPQFK